MSLTCVDQTLQRCIGRTYSFSPKVTGRLVFAAETRPAPGQATFAFGSPQTVRCRGRPVANRNHHCVLVFDETATVPDEASLPCRPAACYVDLMVRADNRHAARGDRLVIGADSRSGSVRRNKGRLAALVLPPRAFPNVWHLRTAELRERKLPEQEDHGLRVVYSVRLPGLRRGDVVAAAARQTTDIRHLPYAAYVSDQLVLARSPTAVRPAHPSPAADGGRLTASNGFNCTHGASAYRTPCVARKAGALPIVGRPRPGPYYVNLVSRSKPKHSTGGPGDFANVLERGFLAVSRFR